MSQPHPNLFLIGAQKGGSSTLAHQMARHPAIAFFSKKEPNFFREADPDACRAAIAAAGPPPEAPQWAARARARGRGAGRGVGPGAWGGPAAREWLPCQAFRRG